METYTSFLTTSERRSKNRIGKKKKNPLSDAQNNEDNQSANGY